MRDWRRKHEKGSRKRLIEDLDEVVSKIVRERDGRCVQCGSTAELTNGHLFSRRYHATRWDVSEDGNCHTQCWNHNKAHSYNRDLYIFWYVGRFGGEAHAELRDRAFSGRRYETPELEELLERLTRQLKEMQA